jgi:hypothetical protein
MPRCMDPSDWLITPTSSPPPHRILSTAFPMDYRDPRRRSSRLWIGEANDDQEIVSLAVMY